MSPSTTSTTDAAVRLERDLAASPSEVWAMWTEASRFAAWYGPPGATITVHELDPVVGGGRHIAMDMETPNGPMTMWFVGEHQQVDQPRVLSYTESMADADGTVIEPSDMGMPADHPRVTLITVALEPHDTGTHLVLTHAGVAEGSPGEQGWIAALDALVELLAS